MGFWAKGQFFSPAPSSPVSAPQRQMSSEKVAQTKAPKAEPMVGDAKPVAESIPKYQPEESMAATDVDDDPPRLMQFYLSEPVIEELEEDWSQLRDLASAQVESNGWRIFLKEQNTPFAKLGIFSGDLIKFDALDENVKENPDSAALVDRTKKIFNHISN